jgi:hypothetical protein
MIRAKAPAPAKARAMLLAAVSSTATALTKRKLRKFISRRRRTAASWLGVSNKSPMEATCSKGAMGR